MDEKPDQIIEHIEARRDELGRNLSELESKVRRNTDWHTYYEKNPMMILGAALGGGLLIGAVVGGSSSRSRTKGIKTSYKSPTGTSGRPASSASSGYYTPADTRSSFAGLGTSTGAASQQPASAPNVSGSSATAPETSTVGNTVGNITSKLQSLAGGQMHQVNEAVDHIRGALIAFGIAKVKEFLSQSVPGLENHLGSFGDTSEPSKSGSSNSGSYTTGSAASSGSGVHTGSGASDYRASSQNPGSASASREMGSAGQPGNSAPSAATTNTGRVSEADEYAGSGNRATTPRQTP